MQQQLRTYGANSLHGLAFVFLALSRVDVKSSLFYAIDLAFYLRLYHLASFVAIDDTLIMTPLRTHVGSESRMYPFILRLILLESI